MPWWDFYKIFNYAFADDPQTKLQKKKITGVGLSQPEAALDVRGGDNTYFGNGGSTIALRESNEFIDVSQYNGRQNRYKEYERLRNIPEIESIMTIMAEESCLAGDTLISTVKYGLRTIKWLCENVKEEFYVYCWDFQKNDYSIGMAYNPRLVKKAETKKILLDDGTIFTGTLDHRVLLKSGEWTTIGNIEFGTELMPFYKIPANKMVNDKIKINQFPRIFTFTDGWKTERRFLDEWTSGRSESQLVDKVIRAIAAGLTVREISKLYGNWHTLESKLHKEGFSFKEVRSLGKKSDRRRVIGIQNYKEIDVYDLSVKDHENFCGESVVFHNCQKGENEHVCQVICKDESIKLEIERLFFHRKNLNIDRKLWNIIKKTYINGDHFIELVIDPDNPKSGILKMQSLPCASMYRIQTTKGRLIEFQQSATGADIDAVQKNPIEFTKKEDLSSQKVTRFPPEEIIHLKIGDDRDTFYPYGQSLIEPARSPAHSLKLMEDCMLVYRLSRAPERKVFYIDTGGMAGPRAEAFVDRMKDAFRKKKVVKSGSGASAVDEKYHAPSVDEDYWVPTKPNSNTRIDTLPGASNLSDIDDALYFRNKLFVSLNFPKNYLSNEDVGTTRITLSALDSKFARMIERLQESIADGLWEIADRHLQLKGYPEEVYEDLIIKMTPPSAWRELSQAEVITNRINNATSLKGSMLLSDYDILTNYLMKSEDDAKDIIARNKLQKLEELKIQVLAQNPQLLGIGVPGDGETEMGVEPGGPNPNLTPEQPENTQEQPENSESTPDQNNDQGVNLERPKKNNMILPDPTPEDIKKYDLEIYNYSKEQDREEIDYSDRG